MSYCYNILWTQYLKVAIHCHSNKKHLKGKVLPSRCHLFACGWINGHNSAILAPINFYLTPLYSLRASDSDGLWRNHVTQNGCWEQVLNGLDTTTMQHTRFIASCQVSSCIHKNIFYTTKNLKCNIRTFIWCTIKAYRIRHTSSHYAFFITCIKNPI